MSISFGLFMGALGALVGALPAAFRVSEPATAWVGLAGSTALVLGPALAGAARGKPLPLPAWSALAGLALAILPLSLFAQALKVATHHRPLGAVTFAVGALVIVAVTTVSAARVLAWASAAERSARTARAVRATLAGLSALGPLYVLPRLLATPGGTSGAFDVAASLGSGAIFLLLPWPSRFARFALRFGAPVWLAVVAVGLVSAYGPGRHAAAVASPALFAPVAWLLR